ncbi:carboxypeptidase regulatory-like domain-containing protein [Alloacidobacterium dinghuense]|uniref:Carboxypeptidase regulatory-like domain-containing protein n=1 Tax=Alloacidobacterium dinghuense TaxID=2763107 RepID=A0A7G8BF17_9BACT|nr:TonB-dependent receptor [Alloacidobacterium dinghuense]QNI31137.1 carboxypeptidase regulatory-like domain-containing protein [Alloacidobacterium dinghuense]
MALTTILLIPCRANSQTSSTGALSGLALDPTGALLPDVVIRLANKDTATTRSATSDKEGRFSFLLLPPGEYELQATRPGSVSLLGNATVYINVTETLRLELRLRIATVVNSISVSEESQMVQTDNYSLGRVANETAVIGLPLVTRNFAQIASLSPGVMTGVHNAGELGLGGTALSQIASSNDGLFVHGARSYDNNFLMDGISVSDVQGSAAGSGGIPIPNPDSIQEFKVQTGLYDAGYGRYGGANVSLITKTGGNAFHGALFEFFRNEALDANDYFLNQTGQRRPVLKQNQFGFTLGGPIKRDQFLFFGSYQGTRQVNGVAAGQSRTACSASLSEPPLTDDRTPAKLGRLFGGMSGEEGGTAINPDGSNINPVAIALLNLRLSDGSFLIPTPQTVDPAKPLVRQGFSAFTDPCHFNEDQYLTNVDYLPRQNNRISARFFHANDDETVTFPGNGLNPSGNIRGFPSPSDSGFTDFSLAHTYTFRNSSLNQARIGYVRTRTSTEATAPFKWSDVGVAEGEMSNNNELPSLQILGSVSIASGFPRTITQNSFVADDDLSIVHGPHALQFGGSVTRLQDNINLVGLGSFMRFLSWPDFLLGLSASGNGTDFSNVFASFDDFGLTTREYRVWEGTGFVQDDYRILKSLSLNAGLRYEHLGQFGDELGRNSSFDIRNADPNPPATGSVAGYIVASNFPGTPPPGVQRAHNTFANEAAGQNTIAPRIGFAWQFSPDSNTALRGGYGIYYSRPTGQAFYQNVLGAPFSVFRLNAGEANADATFQVPFAQPFPTPDSFPMFPAYSPTSTTTIYAVAPGFRPAIIQQYSLNVQTELHEGWLSEIGYVGTRGTHLMRQRSLNQALQASAGNPIRGVTTNTIANILLRVPIPGVPPDSLQEMESEGSSWYNGLEASLTRRLNHGLQFLASYTFSKTLDTDGADINSTSSGNALTLGDQNSPQQRWGRASFDRTHRFVFSTTWTLPKPPAHALGSFLRNWSLSAIATIQSGNALTIAETNSSNVFGISEDRAQLSATCSSGNLVRQGPVESKLNNYFNSSCFTSPPAIGSDGIGTAFGNSATGIIGGPAQANLDLAFSKAVIFNWPRENTTLLFRTEFYNALNHPQFSNPDTNFTSATFGVVSSTAVNPRVAQLALKLVF